MVFKDKRILPGRVIVVIDLMMIIFSIMMAYALRFNFQIPESSWESLKLVVPVVIVVRFLSFIVFKTYAGLIRYTSTDDAMKIFFAVTAGSLVFSIINLVSFQLYEKFLIPYSIIIIDYLLSTFLLMGFRLSVKVLYLEFSGSNKEKSNVLIYGAGEAGVITKRTLEQDPSKDYKVIAFLDDNPRLTKNKLEGVNIVRPDRELENLLEQEDISLLIFSTYNIPTEKKQEVAEICLKHKTRILNVPPMTQWINGELSFKQIRQLKIEDLLEREPIKLSVENIKKEVSGKSILVTGAAGSIGSEIVRQLLKFLPGKLILVDQAETPLYELELEVNQHVTDKIDIEIIIADICKPERIEKIFSIFKPDIVYHAAAYKHVPVMEEHPVEAVRTNILGTKILADLAVKYHAKKFVFVSTDKAVNPTNVMGASKRTAEIYVQSLNSYLTQEGKPTHTAFITTRFGNVLGSNGSVIQLFKKQIEKGGPLTITHPDVTRFFMTIPEACQLVLEAGAMGKGGEIFIFDMGKAVKIVDLAKKMIRLSGLELGKDISLVFTGLRPGEKLYEELLNQNENNISTHHDKIMIAQVIEYPFESISGKINQLLDMPDSKAELDVVRELKEIVPEYKSKHSKFEVLDS